MDHIHKHYVVIETMQEINGLRHNRLNLEKIKIMFQGYQNTGIVAKDNLNA